MQEQVQEGLLAINAEEGDEESKDDEHKEEEK